ncbi:hypothetical protein [Roseateles noduli]|uniref:hypothetical protein n=1 Tax=Roseateles noduli TaxID=2052484 RepID=UPI003D64841A
MTTSVASVACLPLATPPMSAAPAVAAAAAAVMGLLFALAATPAAAAGRKEPPSVPESQAIDGIHDALRASDCALVASRLNDGLKRKYPSVYLLAGTLYEQGLCLKPDWERAARLYQQAHVAGEPQGLQRMIAGLAEGGRDRAAAMYWALEDPSGLPDECLAGRELRSEPEAYVAQLRRWPAGRLDACVYLVGVASAIAGEIEYPSVGTAYAVYGRYQMDFHPAAATVEWEELELRMGNMGGAISGDDVRERDSARVKQTLRTALQETSHRALRRFTKPADVPTQWRIQREFAFNIHG